MLACEYCGKEHGGEYASGRFCSVSCAHGFSTRAKREEINRKVSKKLTGRKVPPEQIEASRQGRLKSGYRISEQGRKNIRDAQRRRAGKKRELEKSAPWSKVPYREKARRVREEQNNCCEKCGLDMWNGQPIYMELHHKDGDRGNSNRDNLVYLCLNCHSQTETYRGKSRWHRRRQENKP